MKGESEKKVNVQQRSVAGMGQLHFVETCEKKAEKGVTLSRASAQKIRPHYDDTSREY